VKMNLRMRILLGSSFYRGWEDQEVFVTKDPLGNAVDKLNPWNRHTIPTPQESDFLNKYSWTVSPRWLDGTQHLALEMGPLARLWPTALAGLVDCGVVKATGRSVEINLPRTITKPEVTFTWKIPYDKAGKPLSNAIERNRARIYFQAYSASLALHFIEKAQTEPADTSRPHHPGTNWIMRSIGCGFTETTRGALCHHIAVRDGKIINYSVLSPNSWNVSPRDLYGTPGPCEEAVQNTPIFEDNPSGHFEGIDLMRAARSFAPDVMDLNIIPTFL
jgi:hydrogenase large subunit